MDLEKINTTLWINNFIFVFMIGVVCNITAIAFNGGKMPVFTSGVVPSFYIPFQHFSEVSVPYLTDIFSFGFIIFSIGDVFLLVSVIGMFTLVIKRIARRKHGTITRT